MEVPRRSHCRLAQHQVTVLNMFKVLAVPTSSPAALLDEACTPDDLATVTERAKACARKWENIV